MRSGLLVTISTLLCCIASASPITPATYSLVATSITGAQTQIDAFHTSNWSFSPAANWNLGGGQFVMKDGSATTTDTSLTLWDGAAGSGSQVAQITLTNAQFKTIHGGNDQSFSTVNYFFSTPYTLTAGHNYSLALTSSAPNVQSAAYFIKGNSWGFQDSSGNPLPAGYLNGSVTNTVPSSSTATVPEPSSWLLIATGAAAFVCLARRRTIRESCHTAE